jgi:hypothetical protein
LSPRIRARQWAWLLIPQTSALATTFPPHQSRRHQPLARIWLNLRSANNLTPTFYLFLASAHAGIRGLLDVRGAPRERGEKKANSSKFHLLTHLPTPLNLSCTMPFLSRLVCGAPIFPLLRGREEMPMDLGQALLMPAVATLIAVTHARIHSPGSGLHPKPHLTYAKEEENRAPSISQLGADWPISWSQPYSIRRAVSSQFEQSNSGSHERSAIGSFPLQRTSISQNDLRSSFLRSTGTGGRSLRKPGASRFLAH